MYFVVGVVVDAAAAAAAACFDIFRSCHILPKIKISDDGSWTGCASHPLLISIIVGISILMIGISVGAIIN